MVVEGGAGWRAGSLDAARIAGGCRRWWNKEGVAVEIELPTRISAAERVRIEKAEEEFGAFLEAPA